MNIIIDDLLVNYSRQGSGRQILMLHGWADSGETFTALAIELAQNYEVICLDLAGFGKSQSPREAWGLSEYAEYVQQFARKLAIDPYAVIGHSNGGAIAMYAASYDLLVPKKLILLASAGVRKTDSGKKLAWKALARSGKLATSILPGNMRSALRGRLYKAAGSDMLIMPEMEATFKKVVAYDIQKDAGRISQPTLILNGTNDTATPPEFAQMLHRAIHGSKLHLIDGAGHFLHQTHTLEVANFVKEFLKRNA